MTPRILHVCTIAETLRRFIVPIAEHFRGLGWEVDAAASGVESDAECLSSFSHCFDVPLSRSVRALSNVTKAGRVMKELASSRNYDIVHVHTPIASFVTRRALRKRESNQKLVYTAHGFHFLKGASKVRNGLFAGLEKWAAPWMDHLIVMNQQDFDAALRLKIATPEKLTFMHGIGIDLDEFKLPDNHSSIRAALRDELKLDESDYLFLLVARFDNNKRQCDAIQAMARLIDRPKFHLVLAGDGSTFEACQSLAKTLGLKDRVHFLGFRHDIKELLIACDVLLLVSLREGLPRSIMESLALKKKVIGTEIRGTTDLLRNGVGQLVPPASPEHLAQAMKESQSFVSNVDQATEVLNNCSLPKIISQHEALYRKLLEQ